MTSSHYQRGRNRAPLDLVFLSPTSNDSLILSSDSSHYGDINKLVDDTANHVIAGTLSHDNTYSDVISSSPYDFNQRNKLTKASRCSVLNLNDEFSSEWTFSSSSDCENDDES